MSISMLNKLNITTAKAFGKNDMLLFPYADFANFVPETGLGKYAYLEKKLGRTWQYPG